MAPDSPTPELFIFLHCTLFTNAQLNGFSATLVHLLERLDIEEPEGQEWTMIAVVNIGALLEYGRPQGVLQRTGTLGQMDCNPAAIAATTKAKLARRAQADNQMEVDGNEHRQSSDMAALHTQNPSIIQVSPML